jgi:hypothetical protein
MRQLAGLVAVVVAASIVPAARGASLADLAWMSGSWSSTQEGKVSEEHWTAPAGGMMLGVHRDVDGATAAFEFLRIEQSGDAITYLASPRGKPATPFALVESSKERVVFANPEHDFPKKILYWREGASLCASIEGPRNGQTVSERWCWEPASLR